MKVRDRYVRILLIMLVLLLLIPLPLTSKVRSIRSRQLTGNPDVTTTQYARISPSSLLSQSILRIIINNDSTGQALLKVDFTITIETPSGSSDWDGTMGVSLYPVIESGRTLSIDNTAVFENLDEYLEYEFGGFSASFGSGGSTYPGGLSQEDISTGDIASFLDLLDIPEGDYTIAFHIYEKDYEHDGEGEFSVDRGEHEVTFKVVQIGQITIDSIPSIEDLSLSWSLPMVPNYDFTYKTSSVLTITGTGVNFSKTFEHGNPAGTSLKGYPAGTEEGSFSYDLSDLDIPFRAGGNYTATISFYDWNGVPIATAKNRTFSFPVYYPQYISPEDGQEFPQLDIPLQWSFDEYDSWVSSYDLYIDNRKVTNTTGTRYQYNASFGKEVSWYVIPRYSSDDQPFFTSAPNSATFSTPEHTPPVVSILSPESGMRLLKGYSYSFEADAEYFDETSEESFSWQIGSRSYTGRRIEHTPTGRYPSDSLAVKAIARDSSGASSSTTVNVSVLDPSVSITGERDAFANSEYTFRATTRDIEEVSWLVTTPDGRQETHTGDSLTYRFENLGTYTIEALAEIEDSFSNSVEVRSGQFEVRVTSEADPEILIESPRSGILLPVGQEQLVSCSIQSPNSIASTRLLLGSELIESAEGPMESIRITPSRELLGSQPSRSLSLTVEVTDEFGNVSSDRREVLLIDPIAAFKDLEDAMRIPVGTVLSIQLEAPFAQSTSVWVDQIPLTGYRYTLTRAGIHTFKVTATWLVSDGEDGQRLLEDTNQIDIYSIDSTPPQISILFPTGSLPLLAGQQYELSAIASAQSGIEESWWLVDGHKLPGNEATITIPIEERERTEMMSFSATNADGVRAQKQVAVRIIDPRLVIQWPQANSIRAGSPLLLYGALSSSDADLIWDIDGTVVEDSAWDRRFESPGEYTITPGFRVQASDREGRLVTYQRFSTERRTFTVLSTVPPVISPSPQLSSLKVRTGSELSLSTLVDTSNEISSIRWVLEDSKGSREIGRGENMSYTPQTPGQSTIGVIVEDSAGLVSEHSWDLYVIDPSLSINYPADQGVYGIGELQEISTVQNAIDGNTIVYLLDGEPFSGDLNQLTAGQHSLTVTAQYSLLTDDSGFRTERIEEVSRFTLTNDTPPIISLEGLASDDTLLAQREYTIEALIDTAGNEEIESVVWDYEGRKTSGSQTFRLDSGGAGAKNLKVTVTDSSGLSASRSVDFTVVDPQIEVLLPVYGQQEGIYPDSQEISLTYSGRSIDSVSWILGSREYTSNRFVFRTPGTYRIQAIGRTRVRLPEGGYSQLRTESAVKELRILSAMGLRALTLPSAYVLAGSPLEVRSQLDGNYASIKRADWYIDGSLFSSGSTLKETQKLFPSMTAGQHSLKLIVTDLFGRTESAQTDFLVYEPVRISITSPDEDAVYGDFGSILLTSRLNAAAEPMILRRYWSLDGVELNDSDTTSYRLDDLPAGDHTIGFHVVDRESKITTETVEITAESDVLLSLLDYTDTIYLLEGSSIRLRALLRPLDPSISLSSIEENLFWSVDSLPSGSGLSFDFEPEAAGKYVIRAHYSSRSIEKASRPVTVVVDPLSAPVIESPADSLIVYDDHSPLLFEASGDQGALYTWLLDDQVIGRSRRFMFDPAGYNGIHRLQVIAESGTQSRLTEKMLTFVENSPPMLSLVVPPLMFVGSQLEYSAGAVDANDGTVDYDLLLDGVELSEDTYRLLTRSDVGRHQLQLIATDSQGLSSSMFAAFSVKEGITALEVTSPAPNQEFTLNETLELSAHLLGDTEPTGPIQWSIEYPDSVDNDRQTASGFSARFSLDQRGKVLIRAQYTDTLSGKSISESRAITVRAPTDDLRLVWPHGQIVDASTPLDVRLLGLEEIGEHELLWFIDGIETPPDSLIAPKSSGEHSLASQVFSAGQLISQKSVTFRVNTAPKLVVIAPQEGERIMAGSPVVFSATVTDDSPEGTAVRWQDADGTIVGDQSLFMLRALSPGTHTFEAVATDRYGLESQSVLRTVHVHEPLQVTDLLVNGAVDTFALGMDPGIEVSTKITGGIQPVATWKLLQGERTVELVSPSGTIPVSPENFSEGMATVELSIVDGGTVAYSHQWPISLRKSHTAQILGPVAALPLWVGEPQSFWFALTGFSEPQITALIDGTAAATQIDRTSSSGSQSIYKVTIDTSTILTEGIRQVTIIATEDGVIERSTYDMSLFLPEAGLRIEGLPEVYDLLSDSSLSIQAVTHGLSYDHILWQSSSQTTELSGERIDVAALDLSPGLSTITASAIDENGTIIAQDSASLAVTGALRMIISPQQESVTIEEGSSVLLSATAFDRDGSSLEGDSIRWLTHSQGQIGTGSSFSPGESSLTPGDYVLTIEATGLLSLDVLRESLLLSIRPKGTRGEQHEEIPEEQQEKPPEPPRSTFTQGRLISPIVSRIIPKSSEGFDSRELELRASTILTVEAGQAPMLVFNLLPRRMQSLQEGTYTYDPVERLWVGQ